MLVEANKCHESELMDFLYKDPARNYFILLSLHKDANTYSQVYLQVDQGQVVTGIFKRQSGNLQLALSDRSDLSLVRTWLINHDFKLLICPRSYGDHFMDLLVYHKEGAEIGQLKREDYKPRAIAGDVKQLMADHLEAVEDLYRDVFSGYPKLAYMKEKLQAGRGVGFYIEPMKSVAQSDMGCLIVGVATQVKDQGRGFGRQVMQRLIQDLFTRFERVYLQYDDAIAGHLYKSLGFKVIDQVYHYEKR